MIYALHGFLGLPSDWNFLKSHFSSHARLQVEAENLWQNSLSMKDWAQQKSEEVATKPGPRVLLGYSMGGRLAMHLLIAQPKLWDAAIFVSANPGTASVAERSARKELDHNWTQRFLKDDWEKVVFDWNKQNLFTNTLPPKDALALPRPEKDFDRKALARVLEEWSLAQQDDLAVRLAQVNIPVLWMAGEHDEKYCDLLSGFPQVAKSHRFEKISGAAHRAPWDHPSEFISKLESFLSHI